MSSSASISSSNVESSSAFSTDLFTQIISLSEQQENVVMSPTSIQTCVGLALFGAKGTTETEMIKGLHIDTSEKQVIAKRFSKLMKSSGSSPLLSIANKMYVNDKLKIKKEFNEIAKDIFQSEAEAINFKKGDEAVHKINSWIENKTNSNIKNLVKSVDPDTSMILVNAVHLKAEWKFKFDKFATHKSTFWITSDKSVEVDFMTNADDYKYADWSDLDAVAIDMPYKDSDLSMVIILPKQRNNLETLERKLINFDILNLANQMRVNDVDIYLPKFKIESEFNLNDALKKMGMSNMFSDNADFGDLLEETNNVKVSKVVHKAFINVDEAGTEASAATYMKMVPMSLNLDQKLLKVDHPFLYFIKDQEYIYFMGHITKF